MISSILYVLETHPFVVFNNQQLSRILQVIAEQLELDVCFNRGNENPYFMESVNLNREELLSLFSQIPKCDEHLSRMVGRKWKIIFWNVGSQTKGLKMSRIEVITPCLL